MIWLHCNNWTEKLAWWSHLQVEERCPVNVFFENDIFPKHYSSLKKEKKKTTVGHFCISSLYHCALGDCLVHLGVEPPWIHLDTSSHKFANNQVWGTEGKYYFLTLRVCSLESWMNKRLLLMLCPSIKPYSSDISVLFSGVFWMKRNWLS